MCDKYSVYGPDPRTPSCMQRSDVLSIDFNVSSQTDWAAQLKINPLYAILSGFQFGDTPGVGAFYDVQIKVEQLLPELENATLDIKDQQLLLNYYNSTMDCTASSATNFKQLCYL